jgi:hypothetical protein
VLSSSVYRNSSWKALRLLVRRYYPLPTLPTINRNVSAQIRKCQAAGNPAHQAPQRRASRSEDMEQVWACSSWALLGGNCLWKQSMCKRLERRKADHLRRKPACRRPTLVELTAQVQDYDKWRGREPLAMERSASPYFVRCPSGAFFCWLTDRSHYRTKHKPPEMLTL